MIQAVGPNLAANYPGAEVKDLKGAMVTPGIVCSHNHFYSGLSRGILANIKPSQDFISILINLWWRLDRAIDQDILYYSGLVCVLEAIKAGSTSVIDHHARRRLFISIAVLRLGLKKRTARHSFYETRP